MLTQLSIRDFAVIATSELEFGQGMTVISGETGAGKSLLVDALGFLSGNRADAGMVRHGCARAELAAEFDLSDAPVASAWLAEQELDDGAACQLRRVLRADGGSKAWINGRAVTLAQLAELAARLVEIHGQHAHQALLSRSAQLDLLDATGGLQPQRAAVAATAGAWRAIRRQLDALTERGDVADRIALLDHQHAELVAETLEPEAVAELFARHRRQANSSALQAACDKASVQLEGDEEQPGAAALAHGARVALARMLDDEPALREVDGMLEAAAIQLDEALAALARVRDELQADPAQLDALDRRIGRLHDLARKHRTTPGELAGTQAAIAIELDTLRNAGEYEIELRTQLDAAHVAWRADAAALARARTKVAKKLSVEVSTLMDTLGMAGGRFVAELEPRTDDTPDAQGSERVEFLVSANPGQPPRPLRKVASGGELSRIALAIEVAALGGDLVPTMVFDEVDTGISGAIADVVGRTLRQLGGRCQVMCVTHLPQVAAHGHRHYRVSKRAGDGVTQSALQVLEGDARTEELARMLGGADVTTEARAAASRLLADTD